MKLVKFLKVFDFDTMSTVRIYMLNNDEIRTYDYIDFGINQTSKIYDMLQKIFRTEFLNINIKNICFDVEERKLELYLEDEND